LDGEILDESSLEREKVKESQEAEVEENLQNLDVNGQEGADFNDSDPNNTSAQKGKILNATQLLSILKQKCPQSAYSLQHGKRTIGFVGYPNVGKSSTLNSLIGSTKVAVASTPGKTKHFQTIHLPPSSDEGDSGVILCDCPGLVFPSFATTKAEMVIGGVLPIDQLRDYIPPVELLCTRIPKWYLASIYGLLLPTKNKEGIEEDRCPTAEELLVAYASIYH
jgi:large subunit GTPase 1